MCGFAGFLTKQSMALGGDVLRKMGSAIIHRGPNDSGEWFDESNGIGMAHRRLSIIDTSLAGHQPMVSASGRFVIAYNGEIYNHFLLRESIKDQGFNGHSDTESLLVAIENWGVGKALSMANGMFAFALWDRKHHKLYLARDRIGEKPLYYGWQGSTFLFGSELKALKKYPSFIPKINRNSITLLLRHNYIPAPYSIYEGMYKLEPGSILSVSLEEPEPKIKKFWSAIDVIVTGVENQFSGTANDAVDEIEKIVLDSVGQQMIADVSLGAFLSGGIDSSAIVALMQAQSDKPVKTFSIGFSESEYNEAVYAKEVAKYLGTDHTELYVQPEDALAIITKLPDLYCEPFSDSSQIPTFLVSKLASQQVMVSLSGDGGDELFCGYNRYQMANQLWGKLKLLPLPVRSLIQKSLTSVSPQMWNSIAQFVPKVKNYNNFGDKIHKGAGVLSSRSIINLYHGLISSFRFPGDIVIGGYEPSTLLTRGLQKLNDVGNIETMMALDLMTYLPDDILVKVDRAAMGVSLETRVPFLDQRIIEFAWTLPQSVKLKNGQTKWPLRQMLYRYVPKQLIDRPKMGFGVPIGSWLRGPLRGWAEDLLSESRLRQEGYFHPQPIRLLWEEHLSGKRNWQHHLWNVLMFQAWLSEQ